jgi:hypothetical protein
LELVWKFDDLKNYLKSLPAPHLLRDSFLRGVTIVLLRAFVALRSTEIAFMNREGSDPSADGKRWKFQLQVKRRVNLEEVVVMNNVVAGLDVVAFLTEVRRRMRMKVASNKHQSFWVRGNGEVLSVRAIRSAALRVLAGAGIEEKHGYRIKHAVVTYLMDAKVPSEKIRSFLRHQQSTRVLFENYVDLHNNKDCVDVLGE